MSRSKRSKIVISTLNGSVKQEARTTRRALDRRLEHQAQKGLVDELPSGTRCIEVADRWSYD